MTALPIVARELVVIARRPRAVWARVGAGTAGMVVGAIVFLGGGQASPEALGQDLFHYFAAILFFFCLLAGLRLNVDAISSEKRDGTLGLLFLTDLRGYDVVLGKLAATSLAAVYAIFALFPIVAITFLLGGIDGRIYGRVFLAAFNALFFSLSAGMLASSICVEERRSLGTAAALLAGLNLAPAIASVCLGSWLAPRRIDFSDLLYLCPWYSCALSLDAGKKFWDWNYSVALAISHLYGWLFLAASFRLVPLSWQHREPRRKKGGPVSRIFAGADDPNRRVRRGECLDRNPYSWLAERDGTASRWVWAWIGLWAAIWLFGLVKGGVDLWFEPYISMFAALALQTPIKIWVAARACRQFVEDRHEGGIELLLTTPLTPREIVRGQWMALGSQFGGPLAAVVLIEVLLFILGLPKANSQSWLGVWSLVIPLNLVISALDIWSTGWVSMSIGLSKGLVKAVLGSVAKVLAIRWILFWASLVLINILGSDLNPTETGYIVYFCVLAVIFDLIFAFSARRKLKALFNPASREPSGRRRRFWRRIFAG